MMSFVRGTKRITCLLLVAAMIVCSLPVAGAKAVDGWETTGSWRILTTSGVETLIPLATEGCQAWNAVEALGGQWLVTAQIAPASTARYPARASLLFGGAAREAAIRADVEYLDASDVLLSICLIGKKGEEKLLSQRIALESKSASVTINVTRESGVSALHVALSQNGVTLFDGDTSNVTLRNLSKITAFGLSAGGGLFSFSGVSVGDPHRVATAVDALLAEMDASTPDFYLRLARLAVDDMLRNFWIGDEKTGHFLPTHGGYATSGGGVIWELAMMAFGVYDMWLLTGEETYKNRLVSQADFIRRSYTEEALDTAGRGNNNWSDDCAWNAQLYLVFYDVTGDEWYMWRAINLLDSVVARWYDEEMGILYYRDDADFMSSYETGIALSWLRLWELTGETRFYDLALRSYNTMQRMLGRDDGLYYCESTAYYPIGDKNAITEGGSASFLAGNMAMAALSNKFHEITGEKEYLDRVYQTNAGIIKFYDKNGVLLNDRDAWTNATFAGVYVSEVLSLPGTEDMRKLIKDTAYSVMVNARTDNGYYGGSWQGPAEGTGSIWDTKGSKAQQSMTTGTTVMMVTAAALLEAGVSDFAR